MYPQNTSNFCLINVCQMFGCDLYKRSKTQGINLLAQDKKMCGKWEVNENKGGTTLSWNRSKMDYPLIIVILMSFLVCDRTSLVRLICDPTGAPDKPSLKVFGETGINTAVYVSVWAVAKVCVCGRGWSNVSRCTGIILKNIKRIWRKRLDFHKKKCHSRVAVRP